jgi:hypothetical protein
MVIPNDRTCGITGHAVYGGSPHTPRTAQEDAFALFEPAAD